MIKTTIFEIEKHGLVPVDQGGDDIEFVFNYFIWKYNLVSAKTTDATGQLHRIFAATIWCRLRGPNSLARWSTSFLNKINTRIDIILYITFSKYYFNDTFFLFNPFVRVTNYSRQLKMIFWWILQISFLIPRDTSYFHQISYFYKILIVHQHVKFNLSRLNFLMY